MSGGGGRLADQDPSEDEVERVAEAIAAEYGITVPLSSLTDDAQDRFRAVARAALAAVGRPPADPVALAAAWDEGYTAAVSHLEDLLAPVFPPLGGA